MPHTMGEVHDRMLAETAAGYMREVRVWRNALSKLLVGRVCRVKPTSRHNGQPTGRSRRRWAGEIREIKAVSTSGDGVMLCLEGHEHECYIPIEEVEFTWG
jgi:hypothetical protein